MFDFLLIVVLLAFGIFCLVRFIKMKRHPELYPRKTLKQAFQEAKEKMHQVEIDNKEIIIIDTETTGLTGRDEVLQLSIINYNGETLFDEYVKPLKKKTWAAAEKIHGISRDYVANCNNLVDYQKQLEKIFKSHKLVVGYNLGFDLRMIKQSGIDPDSALFSMYTYDVMMTYKKSRNLGPFPKLKDCATDLGYTWDDTKAHGSLYDSQATLYCFQKLQEEIQS